MFPREHSVFLPLRARAELRAEQRDHRTFATKSPPGGAAARRYIRGQRLRPRGGMGARNAHLFVAGFDLAPKSSNQHGESAISAVVTPDVTRNRKSLRERRRSEL